MIRFCLALMLATTAPAKAEERWSLVAPTVPFDDSSVFTALDYVALDRAAEPWRLCILYPHLKDAYWLSVNYGMVEEARRLGVSFDLFEAGGYPNLDRQREQLSACAKDDFDAVILGTVSYDGLTQEVERIAALKPVIATVNDIDDRGITAKASVPVKLVLHPILVYLVLSFVGNFDPLWVYTAVLLASLPTATNVFVIGQQYGVWQERASATILITTVISVFSVSALLFAITSGVLPPDLFP